VIYVAAGCAALLALVAIYMAFPNFTPVVQSAARYFPDSPPASSKKQFSWNRFQPTRLFVVQLIVVVLLCLAILAYVFPPRLVAAQQVGIWMIVDASASMSTIQSGETRMARAREEIRRVVREPWPADRCYRLSSFDLALHELDDDARTAAEVEQIASAIEARPLGTDLAVVQRALQEPRGARAAGCRVDLVVVVTDVPAPPWIETAATGDSWIDVSWPTPNIGFTQADSVRDPFSGGVEVVRVRVEAFGQMRDAVTLVVEPPDVSRRTQRELQPWIDPVHVEEIRPDVPGVYRLRVSPGGAYSYDDNIELHVPAIDEIRVDWRVEGRELPARLGWILDPAKPDLRVVPLAAMPFDELPLVLVGSGYTQRSAIVPVFDFIEASPLLNTLNFDASERMGMSGAAPLPPGFEPVLRGEEGATWIAQRLSPPAVYVPGLPLPGDDSAARFSATVFFNAVKWVLQRRELMPLFRLTSLADPEPHGNVLVLHAGEGDTGRTPKSIVGASATGVGVELDRRFWPWVLLAAIAVLVAERWLSLVRGWD
jgi:hypothetical protein